MSVFDDILTTAKNAADVVGKKAIQVKDISRLRLSIIELNKEIGRNFEALGRLVYDAGTTGNSYDVDDSVAAIDDLYEELSILSDEMNRLRHLLQQVRQPPARAGESGGKAGRGRTRTGEPGDRGRSGGV